MRFSEANDSLRCTVCYEGHEETGAYCSQIRCSPAVSLMATNKTYNAELARLLYETLATSYTFRYSELLDNPHADRYLAKA